MCSLGAQEPGRIVGLIGLIGFIGLIGLIGLSRFIRHVRLASKAWLGPTCA